MKNLILPVIALVSALVFEASAQVVSYNRFEEGTAGDLVSDTVDDAGGDDPMHAYAVPPFDNRPAYSTSVPIDPIPQTGASNTLSLDVSGAKDVYTEVAGPWRTGDYSASSFTMEAYVQFDTLGNYQTVVGRDDLGGGGGETADPLSLFYLQKTDYDILRGIVATTGGDYVVAEGSTAVVAGQWYAIALVGDIDTGRLKLYVDDLADGPGNYVLEASTTGYDGLFHSASNQVWSVGRGFFDGSYTNSVDGQIDEVRFSSEALGVGKFLNSPEFPEPPILLHRYSFNGFTGYTVAEDSVGGEDGIVMSGAMQSGGAVSMDGDADSYVELPDSLISGSTITRDAVSFEAWFRVGDTGIWSRIFDFGKISGPEGYDYLFFTPNFPFHSWGGVMFGTRIDPNQLILADSLVNLPAPGDPDLHVVCIADFGNDRATIYLNGVWYGEALDFSTIDLSDVIDNDFSYLGKSLWSADPNLIGSINEFRIYNGALDPLEVAASYASGPDTPNLNAGALTGIALQTLPRLRVGAVVKTRAYAHASGLPGNPIDVTREPELSYTSDNPSVLMVSAEGVLTAVGPGTANITVTHTDGGVAVSDTKPVEVFVVDYEPVTPWRLTYDHGFFFPTPLPGSHVFSDVPFDLQEDADGFDVFGGNIPGVLSDGTLEIPVSTCGVSEVYTLINTGWGHPGETVGYLRFEGSGGLVHEVDLVVGENVRDWNLNLYEPHANFTTALSTTNYAFGSRIPYTGHLDMQTFTLPAAFHTATLQKITFVTFAPGGDYLFGRAWLAGLTLGVNKPPTVTIEAPASGFIAQVNQVINFAGSFTDLDATDIHTADWVFTDTLGAETIHMGTLSGNMVADPFQFAASGVYSFSLEVTDSAGNTGVATTVQDDLPAYVVVYDPYGGFVMGSGWVWSPAGALYPGNPDYETVAGRATFGFVSKYVTGAAAPAGQTAFRFRAGDLNFHSNSYQWLVVAGARAQFKGIGSINGEGDFGFMLTAVDSALPGGGVADRFRIKIWDMLNDDEIVYDNQAGADDGAALDTELQGGNITIHR